MTQQIDDGQLLNKLLSGEPSDEIMEDVASVLVDEFADSFPELTLKSRKLNEVLQEFRKMKLEEVSSESHYETKLDYIQEFISGEIKAETTDDFSSEEVERFQRWRKYDSLNRDTPLADNTLRDDLYLYREFVQYLIQHRMVPERFETLIDIPVVDYGSGEGVDEKKLEPEIAQAALSYLNTYKYADCEHVAMVLMCESGPRKRGLQGLNTSDFNYKKRVLRFVHSEELPLKNNEDSEREITLYDETPEIINDYLENKRPAVTDSEGEPLLTKGDGRIARSTVQKIAYKWTRPCEIGIECPHDRNPNTCEAAQKNNLAYKCPSSRAPHHIRTGYITNQKNRGVSSDAIDHRCDVSGRVQDKHYDLPNLTEERNRFEDEFLNGDEDSNSGFTHG